MILISRTASGDSGQDGGGQEFPGQHAAGPGCLQRHTRHPVRHGQVCVGRHRAAVRLASAGNFVSIITHECRIEFMSSHLDTNNEDLHSQALLDNKALTVLVKAACADGGARRAAGDEEILATSCAMGSVPASCDCKKERSCKRRHCSDTRLL